MLESKGERVVFYSFPFTLYANADMGVNRSKIIAIGLNPIVKSSHQAMSSLVWFLGYPYSAVGVAY